MDIQRYTQYNDIALYVKEVNCYPMLTVEEERSLATQYSQTRDIELAKKMVTANLRFVVKVAFEYATYGISLLDLIQEGNMGLMTAVKKFDPYKKYRLISYAIWWIRAYIQNYIINNYSLVKIGTTQNQRKLFYNLSKTKKEVMLKNSNPEDINAEIAGMLDVTPVEVDEMELRLSARDFSLEYATDTTGSGRTLAEMIPDTGPGHLEILEEQDESRHNSEMVSLAMSALNEKEKFIIESRIFADDPITLNEVGEKLGITRERVRQIEANALGKLKKALNTRTQ
jgi:RNA polymerase sigma-32 factor